METLVHISPNVEREVLSAPDGTLIAEKSGDGYRLKAQPSPGVFAPIHELLTTYPLELIALILDQKRVSYVCDEISREEDPSRIHTILETDFLAYFRPQDLGGRRILDFGCGSGASTMFLARTCVDSEIIRSRLTARVPRYREGAPGSLWSQKRTFSEVTFRDGTAHRSRPIRFDRFECCFRTLAAGGENRTHA